MLCSNWSLHIYVLITIYFCGYEWYVRNLDYCCHILACHTTFMLILAWVNGLFYVLIAAINRHLYECFRRKYQLYQLLYLLTNSSIIKTCGISQIQATLSWKLWIRYRLLVYVSDFFAYNLTRNGYVLLY